MRVDDFTIAYLIAHGMNADVYAVWHHVLRTPLICKILRAEDVANAKWRRLLRAEGATLKHLNHPGIVRLVAQNYRAPLPFLLLEHVGERTLRDELRADGALPLDRAVRIVQHVGAAIAYAHAEGFLHRDLKPSNIIMRGGRPVLLDFGVAWRLHPTRRPPDFAGTPSRLAPEQIRREPLTAATDVYGLGLLLFELLTATRPFPDGERYRDYDAPLEMRYTQLTRSPLTLREAGRADVPASLEAVVSRALSFDSHARFANVPELLIALDPFTEIKIYPHDLPPRGVSNDAESADAIDDASPSSSDSLLGDAGESRARKAFDAPAASLSSASHSTK